MKLETSDHGRIGHLSITDLKAGEETVDVGGLG
jgi:hypothetical protein